MNSAQIPIQHTTVARVMLCNIRQEVSGCYTWYKDSVTPPSA